MIIRIFVSMLVFQCWCLRSLFAEENQDEESHWNHVMHHSVSPAHPYPGGSVEGGFGHTGFENVGVGSNNFGHGGHVGVDNGGVGSSPFGHGSHGGFGNSGFGISGFGHGGHGGFGNGFGGSGFSHGVPGYGGINHSIWQGKSNKFCLSDLYVQRRPICRTVNPEARHAVLSLKDFKKKLANEPGSEKKPWVFAVYSEDMCKVTLQLCDSPGRMVVDKIGIPSSPPAKDVNHDDLPINLFAEKKYIHYSVSEDDGLNIGDCVCFQGNTIIPIDYRLQYSQSNQCKLAQDEFMIQESVQRTSVYQQNFGGDLGSQSPTVTSQRGPMFGNTQMYQQMHQSIHPQGGLHQGVYQNFQSNTMR